MRRLRRSLLFTPGHEREMLAKALDGPADAVCLDLEDGVPEGAKDEARKVVADVLREREGGGDPERVVRVNRVDGPRWLDDLETAVAAGAETLMVPKVDRTAQVQRVDARLADAEGEAGLEEGSTPLILLLESARGILRAEELAGAARRVDALMLGSEDLSAEVGLDAGSEEGLLWPRARLAAAAAAEGVGSLDRASPALDQPEVLQRDARAARRVGLDGKAAIHPGQLGPIHAVFTPTEEEARDALELVEAAEAAGVDEGGVVRLGDRMVERPHLVEARRTVAAARRAGRLEEEGDEPGEEPDAGALG